MIDPEQTRRLYRIERLLQLYLREMITLEEKYLGSYHGETLARRQEMRKLIEEGEVAQHE